MSDFDVAVVGSGFAGLAAAITARTNGASVLVLDGSKTLGGSSRLSGGKIMGAGTRRQRGLGIADHPEDFYRFYMALNAYRLEPSIVRALVNESGPMIDWLEDLGVEFDPRLMTSGEEAVARMHIAVGEGDAVVKTLVKRATEIGVEFATGLQVDRVLVDDGRVHGVAVRDDALETSVVVLATGGFGANRSLVERYLPDLARDSWWWYIGASTSVGTGFSLGAQVHAQIVGHGRASRLITPNFGNILEGGYLPGWLLVVNAEARRFYDETSSYSITPGIIAAQPAPIYAIFDEASRRESSPDTVEATKKVSVGRREGRAQKWVSAMLYEQIAKGRVLTSDTIDGLAAKLDVSNTRFHATVERYNKDCAAGVDAQYEKRPGVLRALNTPPYYATELRMSHLAVTATGLRIDSTARVINDLGEPVPGLFAAGECTGGVIGDTYVGSGNSITNALTFGRIAGRGSAKGGNQ